jgi:hypothetical protein
VFGPGKLFGGLLTSTIILSSRFQQVCGLQIVQEITTKDEYLFLGINLSRSSSPQIIRKFTLEMLPHLYGVLNLQVLAIHYSIVVSSSLHSQD